MKKSFIIIVSLVFISGCSQSPNTADTNPKNQSPPINQNNIGSEIIRASALGEACGGTENTLCASGLECKKEKNKADEVGICIESIVQEMDCPETKAPVCGIKEGRLNGYLNECQAKRHGAIIHSEGLCKIDKNKIESCDAPAQILGNCIEKKFSIIEFKNGQCEEKEVRACEALSPFSSLQSCKDLCEK